MYSVFGCIAYKGYLNIWMEIRFFPAQNDDFLNAAKVDQEILRDKMPARDPRGPPS